MMNLFIKKILAKYVIYIEIIGYGFVLLFIVGLIALSLAEIMLLYIKSSMPSFSR